MKNDLIRRWHKREKIGRQLVVGLITIFMEQYYSVSACENRISGVKLGAVTRLRHRHSRLLRRGTIS